MSQLEEMSDQFQTVFNKFEHNIVMNENKCDSLDLNEKEEEEFNNIMDERKEYLLRLEVIIGNMKV